MESEGLTGTWGICIVKKGVVIDVEKEGRAGRQKATYCSGWVVNVLFVSSINFPSSVRVWVVEVVFLGGWLVGGAASESGGNCLPATVVGSLIWRDMRWV